MKKISVTELKILLENDQTILIDVRELSEYNFECIDGSYHIPLHEISIDKLPSASKPIVIHCRSGKRSEQACQLLMQQNPNLNLYSLEGGITAWINQGMDVKNWGKKIIPLDRQTQIIAGIFALSGTLLGTFIHPHFYIIPGFVGCGLIFAGITGWCGTTQILSKMPWNK
ncbi:MAG: rhodanese [Candidatus Puniceispirillum sp.]|nr:rhodanese [Candidatus Pelagibacter sp.]MBA4283371.1 rhodanese [Candidatus Puniceispirillum sp.]